MFELWALVRFATQASFSGDGKYLKFQKRLIEEKGYRFMQSFQVNMTTNFNVAMLPFSLSRPAEGNKLEKIKSKASNKIRQIAEKISNKEESLEGNRFYQVLLGGFQRSFFRRSEKKLLNKFKFSENRCMKCKLCVMTCPTGNLSLDTDALDLKRGENCLLCFRCYNFCPGLAINYGKKIDNPEKYKRFTGPVKNLKISDIRN